MKRRWHFEQSTSLRSTVIQSQMTRTESRQRMILRWQEWIQAFTESRRWVSQALFKKVKVEIEIAETIIKSLIEKFIEHFLIHWTLLNVHWTWSCMFHSSRHADMPFWRRRYCYDSDRLIISRGARTIWLIDFLDIWGMFRKSWLTEYRGYCREH